MSFAFEMGKETWVVIIMGFLSAAAAVAVVLADPAKKKARNAAIAIAVVAVLLVAVPFVRSGTAAAAGGPSTAIAVQVKDAIFDRTPDGIPLCAVLHGTAPVTPGRDLWLAYRYEGNSEYYFIRPVREATSPTRWHTLPKRIGDERSTGRDYVFYTFAASKEFSDFLQHDIRAGIVSTTGNKPYLYFTKLPAGLPDEAVAVLRRNGDAAPCA